MSEPMKIPLQHYSRAYGTQIEAYKAMGQFLERHKIVSAEIYQMENGMYCYRLQYFYE